MSHDARVVGRRAAARGGGVGLLAASTLALLLLRPSPVAAHESDQYTLPVGRQFADLGPYFTRAVYDAIVEAVNGTNAAIKRSLRDGYATAETARLQAPKVIAGEVWLQLSLTFPTNESLDNGLANVRLRAKYPGSITAYVPEQSIYDDPLLMLDVTKVIRTTFRASTVSADGKVFGTDKIIHFMHLGRAYYANYVGARQRGRGEQEAVAWAPPDANNLILSENWLLGMATTGIRSNADLAADYAGFKFYRNLTEEVRLGNRLLAPMLVRQGQYWRLNDQVHPGSDFFTVFITPHWNEALNPNVYAVYINGRMQTLLRQRCPDVLDWYRDERGRPLSREQFAQIEQALSTLYGEPYGHQDGGKNKVSIATTCFSPGPASGADRVPTDASCSDWYDGTPFGLQSGWANPLHAKCSSPAPVASRAVDAFGRTPLWWAAKDGRVAQAQRLLAEGLDANAVDLDGEAPLHAAARWGQSAIVEVLIAHGAKTHTTALYGTTPLHVAVLHAQTGAARALLKHGAQANVRDLFGRSPLHDAVSRGDAELVALLVQYGADPQAADESGTTPLRLAARGGDEQVRNALRSPSANGTSTIDRH